MEGGIIRESLEDESVLEPVSVVKVQRWEYGKDFSDLAPGTPPVWTLMSFTAPDEEAEDLAERLSGALKEGPWYMDFTTAAEKFVVWRGRIFRYRRHDAEARKEAEEYARSVGVPESQIDWPEDPVLQID